MTLPRDPADDLARLMDDNGGELGALYRRLPRVDPPKRLDRTVLGEAARAVRGRAPRHHGWIVGVGSAAGVVLAAGIAWQIGNTVPHQTSHEGYRSVPSVVPVQPITDTSARRRESARDAQETRTNRASAEATATPAQDVASPQPARKSEPKRAAPPAAKESSPAVTRNPPAPPPAALAPPQSPAPFPADDEDKTANSADRIQSTTGSGTTSANAVGATAQTGQDVRTNGGLDKSNNAKTRSFAAPSPSGSVELRRDMHLSADDWIAHIGELMRQGRRQQALESLRLLRRMHPDADIPAKLRALDN